MRTADRIAIALLLGAAACSGASPAVFGNDAGGSHDVTTVPDAGSIEMEAASPADATSGDAPGMEIDSGKSDVDAAIDSGMRMDLDAGDDGMAASLCATNCTGCCDKMGRCQAGSTTNTCG